MSAVALPVAARATFARRLSRRPVALASCLLLAIVVVVAVVAPIVLPGINSEHAGDLLAADQLPSWAHPLGTDTLGRDVLDRLLVGTRVTMVGVAEALAVVLLIGVPFGLAAGYIGGWLDSAVTWLADLTFSIPAIVIVIVVLAVFPASMLAGMVALGVLAAPGLMRIVRSAALPVRRELYIEAAEIAGLSRAYVLSRHVLPRIVGVVIVQASLLAAVALSVQTGLAFLNLLVASPAPSWGGMVADGTSVILSHPWLIWPPGVAIALTMLAFSALGDALRDTATEPWSVVSQAPARRRPQRSSSAATTRIGTGVLLSVEGLGVSIGAARVLEDVGFHIGEREIVGLVGESGCGKTVTATALLGLVPGGGTIEEGAIRFAGRNLAKQSERQLRRLRGREIGFISQESTIGLDPAFRVGAQLGEAIRTHLGLPRGEAHRRVLDLLASVHLPDPELIARRYPHELSGGMAQRVAIARALAGEPKLLVADEPTTALDVTVQAEILALLRELRETRGLSILLVTHDWGVVADSCDRVVVMYAGEVVEQGDVESTFARPRHPYTRALLASNPHHAPVGGRLPSIPGVVPGPGSWPVGCRFHERCAYAEAECVAGAVAIRVATDGRQVRCVRADELENA